VATQTCTDALLVQANDGFLLMESVCFQDPSVMTIMTVTFLTGMGGVEMSLDVSRTLVGVRKDASKCIGKKRNRVLDTLKAQIIGEICFEIYVSSNIHLHYKTMIKLCLSDI